LQATAPDGRRFIYEQTDHHTSMHGLDMVGIAGIASILPKEQRETEGRILIERVATKHVLSSVNAYFQHETAVRNNVAIVAQELPGMQVHYHKMKEQTSHSD
jgi:hypothetical protein